ncbi:MAG: M12 family metallopeptidase, partial [Holophagales bacterium]|nr:M12 family metallopeptidase [Holophagales bacterium]
MPFFDSIPCFDEALPFRAPSPSRRAAFPAAALLTATLLTATFPASPANADAPPATKPLLAAPGQLELGAEVAFPGRQGTPKTAILLDEEGRAGDTVHYVDFDGVAVVEGDILLHVDDHGFASFDRRQLEARQLEGRQLEGRPTKGVARTKHSRQWVGGIVPYTLHSDISSKALGWVEDAIAAWEAATSLRFLPRTDEPDYLHFTATNACSSSIGRQGGSQNVNVSGCKVMGSAIHEIGHAVGLFHEHTRRDRDSHVEIVWDNIASGVGNFGQSSNPDTVDIGVYDFGSIMHYHCWAFADTDTYNSSTMTIRPWDSTDRCYSNYGAFYMGQRDQLSFGDISAVDLLYPDLRILAMNSAGHAQGNVLYRVGATDASTYEIGELSGDDDCVTDMDFFPGTNILFALGCEQSGAGSTLLLMSEFGGEPVPMASLVDGDDNPQLATSLALDPITQRLYAIDHGGRAWGTSLLEIDADTGLVTEVGALWGDHTEASSIAFREDGKLFAIDNSNNGGRGETLFTIDIATAQTREIRALHGHRTAADTIRFGANGTLYGSRRQNDDGAGSVLFFIDPDNASTRDVGFFHGDRSRATSMAIRNTASVSPAFEMFAMSSGGHSQGSVLYRVDPRDGSTTQLDPLSGAADCATDIEAIPGSELLLGIGC